MVPVQIIVPQYLGNGQNMQLYKSRQDHWKADKDWSTPGPEEISHVTKTLRVTRVVYKDFSTQLVCEIDVGRHKLHTTFLIKPIMVIFTVSYGGQRTQTGLKQEILDQWSTRIPPPSGNGY